MFAYPSVELHLFRAESELLQQSKRRSVKRFKRYVANVLQILAAGSARVIAAGGQVAVAREELGGLSKCGLGILFEADIVANQVLLG